MPEIGFEYFPSPESNDDAENIAHELLYCDAAVEQWPQFRRELEESGRKSRERCEAIERNAIDILREARNALASALETGDATLMPSGPLLDRLTHAHAYLALHADIEALAGYRRMICPDLDYSFQRDFELAVWEADWNSGDRPPSEVTREATRHYRHEHRLDGVYNTSKRLDPVATAGELDPMTSLGELDPMFPMSKLRPLSAIQLAFVREGLRSAGKRAGLKKEHADFIVRMALDDAKQKDDPAAWRAIRDRKSGQLMPEIEELLETVRQQ
ncbi:MAG TPA: hypothetical protein VMH03_15725 [Terriglobales bacterium]|nr:hypothetical protein [Terriglobales bacterium]